MTVKNLFSMMNFHHKSRYSRTQAHDAGRRVQARQDPEQTAVQRNWISQHRQEIRWANNIIQREMHASAMLFHYQTLAEEESPLDPATLRSLKECDRELKHLNMEYSQYMAQNEELAKSQPPGRLAQRYTQSLRHNSSKLWSIQRAYCQLRGGCCLRDCGCCERSWNTIRKPSGKVRHVHCSGDCGCCIRHRA